MREHTRRQRQFARAKIDFHRPAADEAVGAVRAEHVVRLAGALAVCTSAPVAETFDVRHPFRPEYRARRDRPSSRARSNCARLTTSSELLGAEPVIVHRGPRRRVSVTSNRLVPPATRGILDSPSTERHQGERASGDPAAARLSRGCEGSNTVTRALPGASR